MNDTRATSPAEGTTTVASTGTVKDRPTTIEKSPDATSAAPGRQGSARRFVHDLAAAVASELGQGWSLDTSPEYACRPDAFLHGPDGAVLRLVLSGGRTRVVQVSGVYPRVASGGDGGPTIGVTAGRGPAVIAREITRRLLPGYLPDLDRAQAAVRADAALARARWQLVTDLAGRLSGRLHTETNVSFSSGSVTGGVSVDHGGRDVVMTLRGLSPRAVRAIADALDGLGPAPGETLPGAQAESLDRPGTASGQGSS